MGGYYLPVSGTQDPNDPNNPNNQAIYGPGYAYSPYSGAGAGLNGPSGNGDPDTSSNGFSVTGNGVDVNPNDPMNDVFAENRDNINTTGNTIGQEAGTSLQYYGQQQQNYTDAENTALNQLDQTPGYTSSETSAIQGNPYAPVDTLNSGVGNENSALGSYEQNLSGQLAQQEGWSGSAADQFSSGVGGAASGLSSGLNSAAGGYASGVGGAASGLSSGLDAAQAGFGSLNTAVDNPALGFDPNNTEKQLSNQDVQNIVTAAGTTVGNQFGSAEDQLRQNAAAAGNTSPEALAAMNQQYVTQEAATAGDTMTQAGIQAEQAQFQQAQSIEAQREGATQTQTGLKATAATTEEAAAQSAAATAGQSNIAAQENIGQNYMAAATTGGEANIGAQEAIGSNTQNTANLSGEENVNAAETAGQFAVGQANTVTGQQYGAENTAENEASSRASTVANQRIAGQGAYRSGVQTEQQGAQQGGESAQQTQLGAYGTQTSGLNNNTSAQSNYAIGKPSLGDELGQSIASLFDKGGTVYEPTLAKVAEKGPEMVIPLGRYRSHRAKYDDMGVAA